jgi:hypothetical protein
MAPHGGKRTGAGRKPSGKVRISLWTKPKHIPALNKLNEKLNTVKK